MSGLGDNKNEEAVAKAAELGSIEAIKIMKDLNKKSMVGKKNEKAKTYSETLKNMQSMYVKKSGIGSSKLRMNA